MWVKVFWGKNILQGTENIEYTIIMVFVMCTLKRLKPHNICVFQRKRKGPFAERYNTDDLMMKVCMLTFKYIIFYR